MLTNITEVAADRHPGVRAIARWLDPNPNLPVHLLEISVIYHDAGVLTLQAISDDDPELTVALRKLVEGKDCAVRARLAETG